MFICVYLCIYKYICVFVNRIKPNNEGNPGKEKKLIGKKLGLDKATKQGVLSTRRCKVAGDKSDFGLSLFPGEENKEGNVISYKDSPGSRPYVKTK